MLKKLIKKVYFHKYLFFYYDERRRRKKKFSNMDKEIQGKLQQIEKAKIIKDYDKIEKLYDEILELDNKNEKYIISYLHFLQEMEKKI